MSEPLTPEQIQAMCHLDIWAIEPSWLDSHRDLVRRARLEPSAAVTSSSARVQKPRRYGEIALVDIKGPITKGWTMLTGTNTIEAKRQVIDAVNDSEVSAIMLVVDSPGGTVAGTMDLADTVALANGVKPVYAYVEDDAASAAYWVASQARKVYAGPSADVGSIGVLAVVDDVSGLYEKQGIKTYVVSTGEYKGAFVEGASVLPKHLEFLQDHLNQVGKLFTDAVAAGRRGRVDVSKVSDGRYWLAERALSMGLIDGIGTFDMAASRLTGEVGAGLLAAKALLAVAEVADIS